MKPRRHTWLERRVQLPTHGHLQGVVTLVQEDRFRLEDALGRGYLFTLGRRAGASLRDLHRWSEAGITLDVEYDGTPDLGAVAVRVRGH